MTFLRGVTAEPLVLGLHRVENWAYGLGITKILQIPQGEKPKRKLLLKIHHFLTYLEIPNTSQATIPKPFILRIGQLKNRDFWSNIEPNLPQMPQSSINIQRSAICQINLSLRITGIFDGQHRRV